MATLLMTALLACENKDDTVPAEMFITSDFERTTDGWTGGYAEYSQVMEGRMEFDLISSATICS